MPHLPVPWMAPCPSSSSCPCRPSSERDTTERVCVSVVHASWEHQAHYQKQLLWLEHRSTGGSAGGGGSLRAPSLPSSSTEPLHELGAGQPAAGDATGAGRGTHDLVKGRRNRIDRGRYNTRQASHVSSTTWKKQSREGGLQLLGARRHKALQD